MNFKIDAIGFTEDPGSKDSILQHLVRRGGGRGNGTEKTEKKEEEDIRTRTRREENMS